jgi:hypothetical protein
MKSRKRTTIEPGTASLGLSLLPNCSVAVWTCAVYKTPCASLVGKLHVIC